MEHKENIQDYWDKQNPLLEKLYNGVGDYVKIIKGFGRSFELRKRSIRCIDERVAGGIHIAGSGILLGKERISKIAREANVTEITSHEACGASQLAYDNLTPEEKAMYPNAGEYAKAWTQERAQELGIGYTHLDVTPQGFHIARVVYYDASGTFDPSKISELPSGFIVSRKYISKEEAQKDLDIAISIAFGAHGFGHRFKKGSEFLIIPIAGEASLETLNEEVKSIAQQYGDRVKIDGFNAPHEK